MTRTCGSLRPLGQATEHPESAEQRFNQLPAALSYTADVGQSNESSPIVG
jgi:hypothetical protein